MNNRMSAALVGVGILALTALGPVIGAHAQRAPREPITAADQVSTLPADEWIEIAKTIVNGKSVIGKPLVFMVNASTKELNLVLCRGYQLVGPKPYIKGAPASLPARKVTIVQTEGFNTFCREGVTAQDDNGNIYKAAVVSVDGSFDNATFITFLKAQ